MAHYRSFIIVASALFATVYQLAFAIRAEAAITFSFSDLAMATVVNGEPEKPYAFVSGSITVAALSDAPGDPGPVPVHPVDAVDLTISLNGRVIRSFTDPPYFAYQSYIGDDGTSYLQVDPGIILTGDPLDPLWDQLSLVFNRGLVSATFATIEYTSFQTYQNQEVSYIESVPEPSTWAMVLLGFAGLGFAGYRLTRTSATVRA